MRSESGVKSLEKHSLMLLGIENQVSNIRRSGKESKISLKEKDYDD